MSESTINETPFTISEETRKEAAALIESGVRSFSEHMRQLTEDVKEFEREFKETRRRIKNGARRTTGRIV